jgi:hypothetical protein
VFSQELDVVGRSRACGDYHSVVDQGFVRFVAKRRFASQLGPVIAREPLRGVCELRLQAVAIFHCTLFSFFTSDGRIDLLR